MPEDEAQYTPPDSLLQVIDNLARFHREHEKYYSQAPLRQAAELQARSRALKSLADRWSDVEAGEQTSAIAFAGTEDLNAPGLVAESGILFMEGEDEPAELRRLKREVGMIAEDTEQGGAWLAQAMEQAWGIAGSLAAYPALADLLGSGTGSSPMTGSRRVCRLWSRVCCAALSTCWPGSTSLRRRSGPT
ncbi:hypothetical protein [Streptomyces sp. NPDC002580]|uniref:hypothetical protein n=1 Tax=Streptomyces sp. NPDC002580 TaxID=3364653 RepID=UPI003692BFC4